MKKFHFSIYLFCFFLLAINYVCEKADLQKPIISDDKKIMPRTTCNDCDNDECCSGVQNL